MMNERPRPPVLDMTPEGEFRTPPRPTGFNAFLARFGGIAILVAVVAGGLVLAAVALLFIGLLLPVLLGAAALGAVSLWWRRRRLRKMGLDPSAGASVIRFVVTRR